MERDTSWDEPQLSDGDNPSIKKQREELIKKEIILKAIEDFSKSIETPSTIYTTVYIVYKNGELITKYPKESKERHILLSVDRASYVLTHASDLVKLYFW
jgi:hypothetical protein